MSHEEVYRKLIAIGLALSAERDIKGLMERILREAKAMTHADAGTFYRVTDDGLLKFEIMLNDSLSLYQGGIGGASIEYPPVRLYHDDSTANLDNVASYSALQGETTAVDDVYSSNEFDFSGPRAFDEMIGYESHSMLTVPLKNYDEETIGVLQLINSIDDSGAIQGFDADAIALIEALASQASVALDNRRLVDEQEILKNQLEHEVDARTEDLKSALTKLSQAHMMLKELTTMDAVTGIRNRKYFDDVFEQEWRRGVRQDYEVSLMMIDIDHFKMVNDTYGHLAGDDALRQVAKAIEGMLKRPSDVVARYGGEEFVAILPYLSKENAKGLAEQIREGVEALQVRADGQVLNLTVSVGVATAHPSELTDRRELVSRADIQVYRAKNAGRNRVCSLD